MKTNILSIPTDVNFDYPPKDNMWKAQISKGQTLLVILPCVGLELQNSFMGGFSSKIPSWVYLSGSRVHEHSLYFRFLSLKLFMKTYILSIPTDVNFDYPPKDNMWKAQISKGQTLLVILPCVGLELQNSFMGGFSSKIPSWVYLSGSRVPNHFFNLF